MQDGHYSISSSEPLYYGPNWIWHSLLPVWPTGKYSLPGQFYFRVRKLGLCNNQISHLKVVTVIAISNLMLWNFPRTLVSLFLNFPFMGALTFVHVLARTKTTDMLDKRYIFHARGTLASTKTILWSLCINLFVCGRLTKCDRAGTSPDRRILRGR